MRINDDKLKETVLLQLKEKISSIVLRMYKEKDFFVNRDNLEEIYFILFRMQQITSVFSIDLELNRITSFLLRQFDNKATSYFLEPKKYRMMLDGFAQLLDILFSNGKEQTVSNLQRIEIMIMDHDDFFIKYLQDSFAGTEFHIILAEPDTILDKVLRGNAAILFINMSYPEQKGFKVVHLLRQKVKKPLPIVAITHNTDECHHIEILNSKVNAILPKPFALSLFKATVFNQLDWFHDIYHRTDIFDPVVHREAMMGLIQKEWFRFQRYESYFSLVLVVFDDLKLDNNRLDMIKDFFYEVVSSVREYDEVKLWSDYSIMILLPATQLEGGMMVAKRIKNIVDSNKIFDGYTDYKIGVIASEKGYKGFSDIYERLEKNLSGFYSKGDIHEVGLLNQTPKYMEDTRFRLLIIDDDLYSHSVIQNYLKPEEWIVDVCSNGEKAIAYVLNFEPDIIICETSMMNLDGYAFCLQIRQIPAYRDVIFFFLSRQMLSRSIVRGFQVGADDYITKPFNVEEVGARMKRYRNLLYMRKERGEAKWSTYT